MPYRSASEMHGCHITDVGAVMEMGLDLNGKITPSFMYIFLLHLNDITLKHLSVSLPPLQLLRVYSATEHPHCLILLSSVNALFSQGKFIHGRSLPCHLSANDLHFEL